MFYLAGPTASGKSALALALAEAIGGEVVNADAFQLYAGLPITTAQPSPSEQARLPHHLYGVLALTASVDAQRYRQMVQPLAAEITARGRWPIITGGSGLYLKALTHGLAELPASDMVLRSELLAETTAEQRRQRLLELDPDAEQNVPLANDRYVTRALEICLLTGRPQSELRQQWAAREEPQFQGLLLCPERTELVVRIGRRTRAMLEAGMVDEIAALPEGQDLQALKAIGVAQVKQYLAGQASLAETEEAIVIATRQYAKRQMTWFRREKGFQTICPPPDSSDTTALVQQTLALFPCLHQPPPSAPFSST